MFVSPDAWWTSARLKTSAELRLRRRRPNVLQVSLRLRPLKPQTLSLLPLRMWNQHLKGETWTVPSPNSQNPNLQRPLPLPLSRCVLRSDWLEVEEVKIFLLH